MSTLRPLSNLVPEQVVAWGFWHALRAGIDVEASRPVPRVQMEFAVLERVRELARRQRVSTIVERGLGALGHDVDEAMLMAGRRTDLARSMTLHHRRAQVSRALDRAGVEHVFVKGVLTDPLLWGGRGARGSCDIDVVVGEDAAAATAEVLKQLGAARVENTSLPGRAAKRVADLYRFVGATDVDVDVHLRLMDSPFVDCTQDLITSRQSYATPVGDIPGPDLSMHLAWLGGNLALDAFSGRVKLALDARRFLDHPAVDVARAAAHAKRWGCAGVLWSLLSAVDKRLGGVVDPETMNGLAPHQNWRRRTLLRWSGAVDATVDMRMVPVRFVSADRRVPATRSALFWGALRVADLAGVGRSKSQLVG